VRDAPSLTDALETGEDTIAIFWIDYVRPSLKIIAPQHLLPVLAIDRQR
jgi:hypothetical protein